MSQKRLVDFLMGKTEKFDLKRLFEETWASSAIRPYEELKPPIPSLKSNPKLKRAVARMKAQLLPAKFEGGKIIQYPRVVNPVIETSPYFDTLSRPEQEKVIKHEIAHLIMAQAMPRYRQIHRHGSLFSLQKVVMKESELKE